MRKHASGGIAADQASVPEPSFAERARTLIRLGRIGSLSTQSRKQPGFPFGSMPPAKARLRAECAFHMCLRFTTSLPCGAPQAAKL